VVYLLVGIVGLFVGGKFTGGTDGDKLIIFRVNYLHDIIHLVLGAGWIFASRAHAMAKSVNMLFGVVLLLVAILGFIDPGNLMHTLINSGGSGDPDNSLRAQLPPPPSSSSSTTSCVEVPMTEAAKIG
jgi:hypothetical protein